ncbi:hypothetical protein LCGC14_2304100 [marine sediment metagenome]|uniref:Uncharacterized protein n=1 Tax=marine sediment metagenome TaxID=412755 RepID=A0A0F9FHI5_9ZZZZ
MTDYEKRIADLELQLAGTVNNLGITIARLEDLYRIVERIANHLEWAGVVSRGQTIDREDE